MWIYDQTQPEKGSILAALPETVTLPEEQPVLTAPLPDNIDEDSAKDEELHRPAVTRRNFSGTDCWALAAAFLFGSAGAGVITALCGQQKLEWLNYYLRMWLEMFSVAGARSAMVLFAADYLTLIFTATLLMLFGFSAFGPVLVFLFTMLYGAGNGLLISQLFTGTGWKEKVLVFVLTAVPSAAASACLCILGAAALRVSGRIRAYSFLHGGTSALCQPASGVLLRQYLFTLVILLPLCGTTVGFACLESRLF